MARLLVLVVALLAASAHADSPQSPWAVGVSEADKARAKTSLDDGNALFLDKKYSEALAKYQTALAAWDHPAIRFNIVRCLIQLDRPVDAMDNLKLALHYGAAPLEEAVYREALAYEKLLANQIGELAIECSQVGVKVTLDGQGIGTCPLNNEQRRVAPGTHQVVGVKQGFLTKTFDVVVVGGTREAVKVALDPLTASARIEHRWATWIPWVVFSSGFAIVGGGVLLDLSAAADMDSYDRAVKQQCSRTACNPAELPTDLQDKARTKSNIAVGVMIAGAATIATGGVMLYLNRGRTVYPEATVTSGGAGLAIRGSF